jgi:hypothetical protein
VLRDGRPVSIQHRTHSSRGEAESVSQVVHRLRQQFPELPNEAIDDAVNGRYVEFDGRPIRDFVPILVERAVLADLISGHRPTST